MGETGVTYPAGARLDDRVAVIVGAGSGIGRETALVMARAGAIVVAAARREQGLVEVVEQIRSEAGTAHALTVDVSDWAQVEALAAETEALAGPADILVVTAGVVDPAARAWQIAPADWAGNVQTNLIGSFHAARAFLPSMIARRSGIIVLVSSVAAKVATPAWSAYAASKAGVDLLARVLQGELDLDAIPVRVHVAYPGVVDTPMQGSIRALPEEQFPGVGIFRKLYEKGRLRPPEQPAHLLWWLTTPMAADLKGQVADLDDPTVRERLAADLGIDL